MVLAIPVAPIATHQLLVFLVQIGVLLLLALVLGFLARRIGMPTIVGELAAGVLFGPSILGHLAPAFSGWLVPEQPEQMHLLDAVGQVGVLLLVGITGAQMDFALVRRRGATAVRVSLAGLIVPLGLGVATAYLLPAVLLAPGSDQGVFALFLGVAMCVSAIPVIAKTLTDMKLLHRNVGQLTLAAGVVDDVFGWLMLSVVSAIATAGVHTSDVVLTLLHLVIVIAVVLAVGRPVVRLALRFTTRFGENDSAITAVVVIVFLGAAGTHALGLEAVFGAFVAGILVGSCRGVAFPALAPLRTVVLATFAPLFFATAGLRMDLTALGRPMVLLAALAVLVVAIFGKFAGAYIGAMASRLNRWEALALGAGMNARGVIEVIVAMVGLRLGVLSTDMYTIVILVAIVTSLMAPPVLRVAMKRVEYTAEEQLRQESIGVG